MFSCCIPTGLEAFPNPYLAKLCKILKGLFIGQVVLGGTFLMIDASTGLTMMISGLVLYCITKSMNWGLSLFYIFLCLMEIISGIFTIGTIFSLYREYHVPIRFGDGPKMLKLPIYIISTYYTFLTYKELKALFIENAENAGYELPQRSNDPPPRRYFDGVGHRLS
jgi:hypothetical protein